MSSVHNQSYLIALFYVLWIIYPNIPHEEGLFKLRTKLEIRFSAKSGMCWRQSHRFLSLTSLKTQLKRQKQPLQLFYEKGVLRNVVNFTGKHLYRSLALIELQAKRFKYRCFPVEFTKYLKTEVYQRLLLKPVVSPGVSFRISYTCGSNWFMVFRS